MTQTRRKLLENFDDEVREKLKIRDEAAKAYLSRYERLLMALTRHELANHADFADDSGFVLKGTPFAGDIPLGRYELPRRSGEAHLYRLSHPLGRGHPRTGQGLRPSARRSRLCLRHHEGMVSALEPLRGQSGWLTVSQFTVESLDQAEDHPIISAVTDTGAPLDEVVAARLLTLPGRTLSDLTRSREGAKVPDKQACLLRDFATSRLRVRPKFSAPYPSATPVSSRPKPPSSNRGRTT